MPPCASKIIAVPLRNQRLDYLSSIQSRFSPLSFSQVSERLRGVVSHVQITGVPSTYVSVSSVNDSSTSTPTATTGRRLLALVTA